MSKMDSTIYSALCSTGIVLCALYGIDAMCIIMIPFAQ